MNKNITVNLHYLKEFETCIETGKIKDEIISRNRKLYDEVNIPMLKAIMEQPEVETNFVDFSKDIVRIGKPDDVSQENLALIESQLKEFSPWRKGPFDIFGIQIDAEWKSDLKWNRFAPYLEDLKDKVVCDVGCNNGYFMFKTAAAKPKLVLGIDPTRKFKLAFHYLNNFARQDNLHMELLGFEHLEWFKEVFDTIFCMGILYHHRNPMDVLLHCYNSLNKGGTLLLETMGISATNEVCLFPEKRYANMPNVWFVPSEKAVINMARRAGFKEVECVYNHRLDTGEQRRTRWADVYSLENFLDPENPELTIEGYEAPSRIYFVAKK